MTIHETADISDGVSIPETAQIWHFAQIREGAEIGENCVIGRGAYIGTGVSVGSGCKIQNYALIYEPAKLEDGVFIGPAAILTNDEFPRATNPDGSLKNSRDWVPVGVHVRQGASIGANATVVAPVVIGAWALVGSGSVVSRDVPDFALVVGNPAKRIRWVGRAGVPLNKTKEPGIYSCPITGSKYFEHSENELTEVMES